MRYLLDTDICSYLVNPKFSNVHARFTQEHKDDVCVSVITYAEMLFGMKRFEARSPKHLACLTFLRTVSIEPWTEGAAEYFADIAHELQADGRPIGELDMQIAAHALALKCTLVTNNEKHFRRIPGLKLENWA